jgi:MSHA pilin protein MshD
MCTNKRRATGFTLIEVLIFIVVVAAGLAGILAVMNTTVKSSADPMVRKQALAIAEALLEEIILKDFANPTGGDTGTTRALFDDVSQYNGYSTTGGIKDLQGNPIASLAAYNVSPAVLVATTTDLNTVTAKKITVSITGPGGTIVLSGYRSQY